MKTDQQAPDLIGQSRVFLDALDYASRIAMIDRSVLVMGERGSGKELIASRIHFLSPRWEGPLVKVNCAAMNEHLLESELFGHEAGSFAGASRRHQGKIERAEGGTLFLDEISFASQCVQEKLLRVIEYGEYERFGGEETRIADVRIIAASNVDLRIEARDGRFRADLLDRLAFDVVAAPPLRERKEDITILAAHFASKAAAELAMSFPGFSPKATAVLKSHDWPGNVRELKNVAERAVFHWGETIGEGQVDDIVIDPFERAFGAMPVVKKSKPLRAATSLATEDLPEIGPVLDLRARLDAYEKELAITALAQHGGSQKAAAAALRLTYDQMRGLVKKHNLTPKQSA